MECLPKYTWRFTKKLITRQKWFTFKSWWLFWEYPGKHGRPKRPGNAPFSLVSPVTWDVLGHGKIQMLGTHVNITVGSTSWILQLYSMRLAKHNHSWILLFRDNPNRFSAETPRNRYSRGELCLPLGWVRLRYCVVQQRGFHRMRFRIQPNTGTCWLNIILSPPMNKFKTHIYTHI